jgi:murein DD-endopeptidase MepM/ murein hydrolase activator NlpD
MEREAPRITWLNRPDVIGTKPHKLTFITEDRGAGVNSVVVTAVKNGSEQVKVISHDIFTKSNISEPKKLSFVVDPKDFGTDNDSLIFNIEVTDGSIWKNRAQETTLVKIDRELPMIELVSKHHYGTIGGSLVVWYKILSKDVVNSGVKQDNLLFKGHAITNGADNPELLPNQNRDIHLALVPLNRNAIDKPIKLFALDQAGNERLLDLNPNIKPRKFPTANINLTNKFLSKVLPDLYPVYEQLFPESTHIEYESNLAKETQIEMFRHINEKLRHKNTKTVIELSQKTDYSLIPSSQLVKPMSAALTGAFGETRYFSMAQLDAGTATHEGYDLADKIGAEIKAAAEGNVIYAGALGIYGNTVIIDHGFGLQTLYGHLSSYRVKVGERVAKETIVGNTGMTGLAGGDHLHFETRVHGIAVDPKEWLDPNWFKTRFTDRGA